MAAPSTPASAPVSAVAVSRRRFVTVCTMFATLMQSLDNTIANVALPYMQGSLSATSDQIVWVLTSYVIAAAIFTAPVGWLSLRFGRKPLFLLCLSGFTIASILCGLAQSLEQIVVFRLLQGMFGAALVPLSQATIFDLYPVEQRGAAMATWGVGVMVGPILGPTLGGYLTDAYNWRWVFFINVPFGLLAIAGLWSAMPDTDPDERLKFDWMGFGFFSLMLAATQLMLDRGEQKDWFNSTEIIAELVLACTGLYLFVVHMLTADRPFIPVQLFRDPNYGASAVIMFTVGLILLSSSALLPPYLQILGGYSIIDTGRMMVPRGAGTMFSMLIAGRLASRFDPRLIILAGIIMLSVSISRMIDWTPDVDPWSMAVTTFIQGVGLGFVFVPLQLIAFATLPAELRPEGTSLFSLIRNTGSAVGISVATFLLQQSTQTMHARIAEGVSPYNRMLHGGGASTFWNSATAPGLAALNDEVTRQASIIAYSNDFKFMLYVIMPSALLLLLLRKPAAART